MKGLLVVNEFVKWDKFDKIYDMLTAAFRAKNCSLVKLSNTDLMNEIRSPFPKADFCLFWNKDINLAIRMERSGMRLFNSAHTIEYCNDKCLLAAAYGAPAAENFYSPSHLSALFRPQFSG